MTCSEWIFSNSEKEGPVVIIGPAHHYTELESNSIVYFESPFESPTSYHFGGSLVVACGMELM